MTTNQKQPSEEIDLGSLFSQIGKMFSNMFAAIGNLFKGAFGYLILLLLFLRKNVLVLGGTALAGLLLGLFLQKSAPTIYTSNMVIETNYNSASRLYSQIAYLNALISENDSIRISKIFDVSPNVATQLKSFSVEAVDFNKQALLAYDTYKQRTDTIYTRDVKFPDFTKRLKETDLTFHNIEVFSTTSINFNILKKGILSLVKNDYYKHLRDKKIAELQFKKSEITSNLSQLDTLRNQYRKVALLEAKNGKSTTGVNFSTSSRKEINYDRDLYSISTRLLEELDYTNQLILENEEIVKVNSDFGIGVPIKGLSSKLWFKYGVIGFLLAFLLLVGLKVNKYLSNYEEQTV